mmetsp:Transcript_8225/g.7296  ORF Transcript_8225/g.7296 Transcript_8225/m.7296 type:complete len:113 (+) Transcript_8225:57-395(+)
METPLYAPETSLLHEDDQFEEEKLIQTHKIVEYPEINNESLGDNDMIKNYEVNNSEYQPPQVNQIKPINQATAENTVSCGGCKTVLKFTQDAFIVICPCCNTSTASKLFQLI